MVLIDKEPGQIEVARRRLINNYGLSEDPFKETSSFEETAVPVDDEGKADGPVVETTAAEGDSAPGPDGDDEDDTFDEPPASDGEEEPAEEAWEEESARTSSGEPEVEDASSHSQSEGED